MLTSLTVLFILQPIIYCNIWDNIYSNLNSPQFILPNETKLVLYDRNQTKKGELLVSSERNQIKFSLVDYNLTQTNSSIIDIYFNLGNSTISLDYPERCVYKFVDNLSLFNVKFLMSAYDLLTFYKDIGDYYEYTFSNPLAKGTSSKKIVDYPLNKKEENEPKEPKDKMNLATIFTNAMEEEGLFVNLKVNKTNDMVEKIDVKLHDWYLKDMITKSFKIEMFNSTEFSSRHSKCDLLKDEVDKEEQALKFLN